MRRLLLLLLAFAACSEQKEAKAPAPVVAEAPSGAAPVPVAQVERPRSEEFPPTPAEIERRTNEAREAYEGARAPAVSPAPAASPAPADTLTPTTGERIALRSYEHLLNGRRAATMRVEWKAVERDGRKLIEDITETISREQRDMAGFLETFDSESISRTLRTENGELVSQESVATLPGRVDKSWVERTATGYKVRALLGASEESYEVATDEPVMVDAEAFLAAKIRAGEVKPGDTYEIPLLGDRRVVTSTLRVVGPDEEGPGLKVVDTCEGNDTLWWFADDGSVVRLRVGVRVIRRDDGVRHGDLPARPPSFQITLPSNYDLPRIFTTKQMLVDIVVKADETTKPPQIPESAFTEVVKRTDDCLTLLLKSHDDPKATCPLPIDPKGFEEYLKGTALMEVDDPLIRRRAREAVGDAEDAREAARRIADFVFSYLRKGSSKLLQPTAKQILRDRVGDCSEHELLFTTLCRAAGIPVRQCSGYVCIGEDWGGHAWCEIWVGRWIGADPTTNEIGTRARYILLARPGEPVEGGRITAERTKILIRRAEYDDGTLVFDGSRLDPVVCSGIRLAPLPEGWSAMPGMHGTIIRAPDFTASVSLMPDHGYRSMQFLLRHRLRGGSETTFGGRKAAQNGMVWLVPLGREILQIGLQTRDGAAVEALAEVLAPTLAREE